MINREFMLSLLACIVEQVWADNGEVTVQSMMLIFIGYIPSGVSLN